MATPKESTTRGYNWSAAVRRTSTATSAQTAAAIGFSEIAIFATQNAWVTFSTNPTAAADTAGNLYLSAGVLYHLQVDSTHKMAAIRDSADGAVHIIPTMGLSN